MSTVQRVDDAHSYTGRRGSNPQRHTMLHHFRRDKDAPRIHGAAHTNLIAPSVYVPDSSPILSKHELPRFEDSLTTGVKDLGQLKDRLETEQKLLDVDTLVHIQKATPHRETPPHWHMIITPASCALAVLLALGMFLHSNFQCAVLCCRRTKRGHRRKYSPVPNASSSGFRKPNRQRLCGTTMRQRDVHHQRTTVQRLIHTKTNHKRQLLIRQQDSDQNPSNQGRRPSEIPLTSGLRTAKRRY